MDLEDVRNLKLPELPSGAQYVEDGDTYLLPSSRTVFGASSLKEARRRSPFAGLPLTDAACERQLSDASLPANFARERVREVCSNAKMPEFAKCMTMS